MFSFFFVRFRNNITNIIVLTNAFHRERERERDGIPSRRIGLLSVRLSHNCVLKNWFRKKLKVNPISYDQFICEKFSPIWLWLSSIIWQNNEHFSLSYISYGNYLDMLLSVNHISCMKQETIFRFRFFIVKSAKCQISIVSIIHNSSALKQWINSSNIRNEVSLNQIFNI